MPHDRTKPAAAARPDLPFRVHFEDGQKLDIFAPDAPAARKAAEARHNGIIRKIKIDRESR